MQTLLDTYSDTSTPEDVEEEWSSLVRTAQAARGAFGGGVRRGQFSAPSAPSPAAGEREPLHGVFPQHLSHHVRRCGALGCYLAACAEREPFVSLWRHVLLLQKQPVSREEAKCIYGSPAAGRLPWWVFHKRGIPPANHTSEILEERTEQEAGDSTLASRHQIRVMGRARLKWPGGECEESYSRRIKTYTDELGDEHTFALLFPLHASDVLDGATTVCEDSPWAELAFAGKWLARRFPIREDHGGWFVLTGEILWAEGVEVRVRQWESKDFRFSRVEASAAPWVPAEMIARMRRSRYLPVAGRPDNWQPDRRRIDEDACRLFRFLVGKGLHGDLRHKENNSTWTWDVLWRAWRETSPSEPYANYRAFRKAALAVWERMVWEGQPASQERPQEDASDVDT
ncbi:MAG: hypothetical protein HY321_08765 [Armatimonadetes bacterium]|nr:hypothetical protein [Armatimonadota bacterium]